MSSGRWSWIWSDILHRDPGVRSHWSQRLDCQWKRCHCKWFNCCKHFSNILLLQVTDQNKQDYIKLVCQMKMTGAIRKQLQAFLEGFYDIIPRRWITLDNNFINLFSLSRLIAIFNEQELELLLSGLPDINIDDLKSNSEYHKYSATSLQIVW